MTLLEQPLPGLMVFENRRFPDERGFFEEFFNERELSRFGTKTRFVQVNHSCSKPGVVRGLHYQLNPPQGKLVGVISGRIWDVAVDLRDDSPTYGRHFGLELNEHNARVMWIPAGFAHGFCTLGDQPAHLLYLVDAFYSPDSECGIVWDDPVLNIPWPLQGNAMVSERDKRMPNFIERR